MTIFELLDGISKRPVMYFCEHTISRFHAFLIGWMFESKDEEAIEFINGFQDWIAKKYQITSTHSWESIIAFYASDQVSALDDALELMDEYRALVKNVGYDKSDEG